MAVNPEQVQGVWRRFPLGVCIGGGGVLGQMAEQLQQQGGGGCSGSGAPGPDQPDGGNGNPVDPNEFLLAVLAHVNQCDRSLEQAMTAFETAKANAAAGESEDNYTVLLRDQCRGNHVCIGQVGGKHLAIRGAFASFADVVPLPVAAVVRKRLTFGSGQSLLVTIYNATARYGPRYTVELEDEEVPGCGGSQGPSS